jgi:hypothetical protein
MALANVGGSNEHPRKLRGDPPLLLLLPAAAAACHVPCATTATPSLLRILAPQEPAVESGVLSPGPPIIADGVWCLVSGVWYIQAPRAGGAVWGPQIGKIWTIKAPVNEAKHAAWPMMHMYHGSPLTSSSESRTRI